MISGGKAGEEGFPTWPWTGHQKDAIYNHYCSVSAALHSAFLVFPPNATAWNLVYVAAILSAGTQGLHPRQSLSGLTPV